MSVRVDELTAAPPGVSRVYVVENEITYLAFPLSLYADLVAGGSGGSGGYGFSVRLEQERVGFGDVERAIRFS